MTETNGRQVLGRSLTEWLFGLPVILLLIFTLIIGTGEMVHSQFLKLGESAFGVPEKGIQYYMLRGENPKPGCTVIPDVEAEVARQMAAPVEADASGLGDLFGDTAPVDPADIRNALESGNALCAKQISQYEEVEKLQSPELSLYKSLETGFYQVFKTGIENRPLILLLMVALAAVITTRGVHHVSIRPPTTVLDYRLATGSVGLASVFAAISYVSYYEVASGAGVELEHPHTYFIWITLFIALAGISIKQVLNPPKEMSPGGKLSSGLLSVPLFGFMGIICGVYFFVHLNFSGLAIYINQLLELPSIFLSLALYIWAGMLLKQSRIVDLFMNILRPWKLSPELLTYIILLAAALPTAYTGASGIFVIAAGGIVYNEVRNAGGSRQFALAATAMSGSLGVVLRPCLLVVLIAALNKQVTSNDLYHWGLYVFFLTSTLFFLVSQLTRKKKANLERPLVAIPKMLREIRPILPYIALVYAVILIYDLVLDTKLNESTAPVIMPAIMMFLLIFDKLRTPAGAFDRVLENGHKDDRQEGVEKSIRFATGEAIGHIGALIMLMALSLAVGGVVERAELMKLAPTEFSSPWVAMTFLMVTKVILGMFMDPFGAVILVSGTLAPIAYANSIDPLHFWMMVLVAFELGYLMPPVALNQLLTRLVIGDKEVRIADEEVRRKKFYWRYERWILPTIVMTVGMIITAYGPLAVRDYPSLKWIAELTSPHSIEAGQPSTEAAPTPAPEAAAPAAEPAPAADVAPVAAEPVSVVVADPAQEVKTALESWAAAWSAKDVATYLNSYAADFVAANGTTRPKWDEQRTARISSKQSITVRLEDVVVTVDNNTAVAEFVQHYQSNALTETTRKRLTLKRDSGTWLITGELSIR